MARSNSTSLSITKAGSACPAGKLSCAAEQNCGQVATGGRHAEGEGGGARGGLDARPKEEGGRRRRSRSCRRREDGKEEEGGSARDKGRHTAYTNTHAHAHAHTHTHIHAFQISKQ